MLTHIRVTIFLLATFVCFTRAGNACTEPYLQQAINTLQGQKAEAEKLAQFKLEVIQPKKKALIRKKSQVTAKTAVATLLSSIITSYSFAHLGSFVYSLFSSKKGPIALVTGSIFGGITGIITGVLGTPLLVSLSSKGKLTSLEDVYESEIGKHDLPKGSEISNLTTQEIANKVDELKASFIDSQRFISLELDKAQSQIPQDKWYTLGWHETRKNQAVLSSLTVSRELYQKETRYVETLLPILEAICAKVTN